MRQRLISAAVLVPVVVIVFLLGDPWITAGIALLAALAAIETTRLVRLAGFAAELWLAVVLAPVAVVGAFVLSHLSGDLPWMVAASFVGFVVLAPAFVALSGWDKEPEEAFRNWIGSMIASAYPSLLAFVVALIAIAPELPPGAPLHSIVDAPRAWLLVLVATVWTFDSAAYLTGRIYPRGRLALNISPNKTYSGYIGGMVAATVVCTLLVWAVGRDPVTGLFLGSLTAISAQVGDLVESTLKRLAGMKDSGSLIRGHGGLLDRLDSFLFAAPAMFIAITYGRLIGFAI